MVFKTCSEVSLFDFSLKLGSFNDTAEDSKESLDSKPA